MKQTPADVVIARFGIRPLARDLVVAPSTISRWRRKGNVPAKYHLKLIEMSDNRLTASDLVFGRE